MFKDLRHIMRPMYYLDTILDGSNEYIVSRLSSYLLAQQQRQPLECEVLFTATLHPSNHFHAFRAEYS
jgi:hypothetical protein